MTTVLQAGQDSEVKARVPDTRDRIVHLENLTKTFPARRTWGEMLRHPLTRPAAHTVVDNVSLDVAEGELFGLLGANGAGKTTLFRMLAAHLIPESGSATIAGFDAVRDRQQVRRRLVSVGTDERTLNWRLTARENMELFAALYRVPVQEQHDRISSVLETMELAGTGTKPVGTFSSGMKQRLLIGRALLARPKVLLLDEPTRSLDPISARSLRTHLREEVVEKLGCTVLLATHNAEEAFELCDRVAILERGRLIATGRVRDLMGEVSEDRYHIGIRFAQEGAALKLLGSTAEVVPLQDDTPGWVTVSARIPGGLDGAADVMGMLARAGIDVSHFRRMELSLAQLIERVVERRAGRAA